MSRGRAALQASEIPFASVTATPDGWQLLDDVQLMQLTDPEFLIDAILPARSVGVLYGASGAAKTTLVAGLLTALSTGRDWFGHTVLHRGGSIYVATEDVAGFKVRLRAAKLAAQLPLDTPIGVYTFPEAIDLRDQATVDRFTRYVRDSGGVFELIVVDTYAAATVGASETSSEDTTLAMAHAQRWRDALNTAVLLVHHTNAGGSRERGHTSMRGAADLMMSVTPVDDLIHVECSKQRNAAPFAPFALKLVPVAEGGCVLRLATDVLPGSQLTTMQVKVLAALREIAGQDGVTKAVWRSACPDVTERAFYKVANVLEERGCVVKIGTHFRPMGTR